MDSTNIPGKATLELQHEKYKLEIIIRNKQILVMQRFILITDIL